MKRQFLQPGYDLIIREIPEKSRVLDLGCGYGELLEILQKEKNVEGLGIEISEESVARCMQKGVFCSQGDIDQGLNHYKDNSFDFVILNLTLTNTKKPDYVIKEVMRISRKAIINFPNFAFLNIRLQLLLRGKMPVSSVLPFAWYESPNIHMVTIKDFRQYCVKHNFPIQAEYHFSPGEKKSKIKKIMPNPRAKYGFFILNGENYL